MHAPLFPELVRQARHTLGYDLLTVARGAGCSESYVSLIESEKRLPSEDLALRLAQTLKLDETEALLALLRTRLPEPSRAALSPQALVRDPALRFAVVRDFVSQHFTSKVEHVRSHVEIDWSGDATITRSYEGFQPLPDAPPVKELVVREPLPDGRGEFTHGVSKPRVTESPSGLYYEFAGEARGNEFVHAFTFPEGWTWAPGAVLAFETKVSVRGAYAMDLQAALAAGGKGAARNHPLHASFRRFAPFSIDRLSLEVKLPPDHEVPRMKPLAWLGDTPLEDVSDSLLDQHACLAHELIVDGSSATLAVTEPLPFYTFALAWLPVERAARINAQRREKR